MVLRNQRNTTGRGGNEIGRNRYEISTDHGMSVGFMALNPDKVMSGRGRESIGNDTFLTWIVTCVTDEDLFYRMR